MSKEHHNEWRHPSGVSFTVKGKTQYYLAPFGSMSDFPKTVVAIIDPRWFERYLDEKELKKLSAWVNNYLQRDIFLLHKCNMKYG